MTGKWGKRLRRIRRKLIGQTIGELSDEIDRAFGPDAPEPKPVLRIAFPRGKKLFLGLAAVCACVAALAACQAIYYYPRNVLNWRLSLLAAAANLLVALWNIRRSRNRLSLVYPATHRDGPERSSSENGVASSGTETAV